MTILQNYTQPEYVQGLKNLLPTGFAWPKDEASLLNQIAQGFSFAFQDMDILSCETIDEVFPGTSTVLLPIWQETLGITDVPTDIQEQRNQVVALLTATGAISNSYFINFAKQLGYILTIIEYGGIISGVYRCGDSVGTCQDYSYEFDVTFVVHGNNDYTILQNTFAAILPPYVRIYYISDVNS
ncbi:DUF2313 domain-containing protein (plasmid) [Komagataeibacter medellinensis]|uniref:DUF2313 domain-containing protein n=1 Tax=Komagataeibacter medellinensis TaxID=1177712 RepID=A0ABQ6VQJ6_9PROT|nr:putative phage tail protein [Komagataeibacter medellinensis]KAB8122189.1 DUF2313 domain-containing protein [Komagataeibacter medellinensis]